MGKNKGKAHHTSVHVFPYTSCVDLTQLHLLAVVEVLILTRRGHRIGSSHSGVAECPREK